MTEKFMKLSDFLKLIKKEEEQEDSAGTDSYLSGGADEDNINNISGTEPAEDSGSAPDKTVKKFDFTKAFNISDKNNGSNERQESPIETAAAKKSVSDEELASILSYFGWKTAGTEKPSKPMPEISLKTFEKTAKAEQIPTGRGDIKTEKDPVKNKPQIFDGLDSVVIKEIFTEEELKQLRREETHVFTNSDVKTLSGSVKNSDVRQSKKSKLSSEEAIAAEEDNEDEIDEYSPISRRRAYRTGCFGGILYFGFVVCLSVVLCALAWMAANDLLSLNKEPATAEIYVGEDKNIRQVATELQSKGIIEYKWLFELFAKISDASAKIDPGTYTVSSQLDYRAIITKMQQDTGWSGDDKKTVKVLIPEGKTLTQTFQILSDAGVCAYETLLECCRNYNFNYDFLNEVSGEAQYRLEGYLFPDTYEFYMESSPEDAIGKLLDNYKTKITDEMAAQAKAMGYSMNQVLTIASLIEMEAGSDEERPIIASVIYNRLKSNSYPYLQIDATVQYALGEHKEQLSYEDRQVDSPYNTYKHEGLPPGPIASPGLASIRAALNPASTNNYFYALNKEGTHNFFNDIDSFNNFLNSDQFGG